MTQGGVRFQRLRFAIIRPLLAGVLLCGWATAQELSQDAIVEIPNQSSGRSTPSGPAITTTRQKWNYFLRETAGPLTFGGASFNAVFSQVTHTDPQYGVNGAALAKRFGASLGDIVTENFFGDFVAASLFHEDPRYFRMGEGHGFWKRVGYAISRAVVIRKDSGGNEFNFDNFIGSAGSSAFSNIYYPPPSRTGKGFVMRFGIDVADYGFVNLAPEFWPDFRRRFLGWVH